MGLFYSRPEHSSQKKKPKKNKLIIERKDLTVVSEGEELAWSTVEENSERHFEFEPKSELRRKSALEIVEARKKSLTTGENLNGESRKKSMTGNILMEPRKKSLNSISADKIDSKSQQHIEVEVLSKPSLNKSEIKTSSKPTTAAAVSFEEKEIEMKINNEQEEAKMKEMKNKDTLIKSSPEPIQVVDVLTPINNEQDIAVMSLNLLADFNLTNSVNNPEDGRYKHAIESAPWTIRFPKIIALFEKHSTTDVFALQEVDYSKFIEDLKPFFDKIGFIGIHQWDEDVAKKKQAPHPFGVATFFRKGKYRESFRESRSRSLIVGLRKLEGGENEGIAIEHKKGAKKRADWFIINVHLEADPLKNEKRLAQLSSTLFNLSIHTKIDPRTAKVLVMGDFNSLRDEPPFQWLITGTTMTSLGEEEGEKLTHAFHFEDAYLGTSKSVSEAATYADPFAAGRVDHLLITCETCTIETVLSVPILTEKQKLVGIFCNEYPSDHYPIGCVVRGKKIIIEEEETTTIEDDPNICPLTEGQMRVLLFLENGAPKRETKGGKPTPVELAAIKQHTERINAFCSHLNKNQKAWVNKWRKKFKPPKEEEQQQPIRNRLTRAKSQIVNMELSGLDALFNESKEENSPQKKKTPPPSSSLTKRRQTIATTTTKANSEKKVLYNEY